MRVGSFKKYLRSVGFNGYIEAVKAKIMGEARLFKVERQDCKYPFWLRVPSSDVPTYRKVFIDHEYEFKVNAAPNVIIDAGANIGLASIYFANKYPNAKIISIEAERGNYELLSKNVANYKNVIPVHAALWNVCEEISLIDPGLGDWGFMTGEDNEGLSMDDIRHSVPGVTIDYLIQEYHIDEIDILKVDIEGAEKEVFEDTSGWIDRVNSIVVELHERMKPGCNRNFYCGTPNFGSEWHKGENVFVSKNEYLTP